MDPNAALDEIRKLAADLTAYPYDAPKVDDLTLRVQELDAWLSRGGFPPADWPSKPKRAQR